MRRQDQTDQRQGEEGKRRDGEERKPSVQIRAAPRVVEAQQPPGQGYFKGRPPPRKHRSPHPEREDDRQKNRKRTDPHAPVAFHSAPPEAAPIYNTAGLDHRHENTQREKDRAPPDKGSIPRAYTPTSYPQPRWTGGGLSHLAAVLALSVLPKLRS